jgi:hypothetical protein
MFIQWCFPVVEAGLQADIAITIGLETDFERAVEIGAETGAGIGVEIEVEREIEGKDMIGVDREVGKEAGIEGNSVRWT